MFKQADTKKHVSELSCLFGRVFLCILAHLAHLAQSFFLIFNGINTKMQIQESMSVSIAGCVVE